VILEAGHFVPFDAAQVVRGRVVATIGRRARLLALDDVVVRIRRRAQTAQFRRRRIEIIPARANGVVSRLFLRRHGRCDLVLVRHNDGNGDHECQGDGNAQGSHATLAEVAANTASLLLVRHFPGTATSWQTGLFASTSTLAHGRVDDDVAFGEVVHFDVITTAATIIHLILVVVDIVVVHVRRILHIQGVGTASTSRVVRITAHLVAAVGVVAVTAPLTVTVTTAVATSMGRVDRSL